MNNETLQHHGVMGMKWGVRRYQNKDGTLTEKGKARFKKVESSERLQKSQTRKAVAMYTASKRSLVAEANRNARIASTAYKKADKYTWKSEAAEAKGDKAGFEKYQSKAWKQMARHMTAQQWVEAYTTASNMVNTKISDINSGKVKAGRDFIVQDDYDVFITPISVYVNRERQVIKKKID